MCVFCMLAGLALFDVAIHISFHPFPHKVSFEPVISCIDSRMATNGTGVTCSNQFCLEGRIVANPNEVLMLDQTLVKAIPICI